jgi:8-amino-7-oxononanoate synthase
VFHVKREGAAPLAFLEGRLAEGREAGLLRERPPPVRDPKSFCSNDYLDLAALAPPSGESGAGASRLVSGERLEHVDLERAAASLVGQESALAFTSGYAANVGLLSALAGADDVIVSDALNHASIIDGARLSRAKTVVYPHRSVEAVEAALAAATGRHSFVVTESYFSMDADGPDLARLRSVCDRFGAALLVDEAHALGVLGPEGRGRCAEAGVVADAVIGTFGKSFGAGGAFVAGSETLVQWLWNRARSFVFSTGLSPVVARAARRGIEMSLSQPWRREIVTARSARLRDALAAGGIAPPGFGPIVPWIIGDAGEAMRAARLARERGLDVRAIRPPTVAPGSARLRLTVTAAHDAADIDRAASILVDVARTHR